MTPTELCRATWIPHPVPTGEQVELLAPWTTSCPARVLTAVAVDGGTFVIARNAADETTDCWMVLLSRPG